MARSRNIKPGFFENELLGELPPLARLLFAGLWMLADREGRLQDRPERIKVQLLPYDRCNLDKLLQLLHDADFILRYQVDNRRYIWIRNFRKHQNPHIKEVGSTIPGPTGTVHGPENRGHCLDDSGSSPADPPSSDSSFRIPETLPPAGRSGVSDGLSREYDADLGWERFISDWPNLINLDNARRLWKIILTVSADPKGLEAEILSGKARYQTSGQWARGAFDAPDRWLEKRKWLDRPAPALPPGQPDVWADLAKEG